MEYTFGLIIGNLFLIALGFVLGGLWESYRQYRNANMHKSLDPEPPTYDPTPAPQVQWFYGPPPSVGWWPASMVQYERNLRWWDGECWSIACADHRSEHEAEMKAATKCDNQVHIQWTHRPDNWPVESYT